MAREMMGVIAAVIVGITAANACHWLANKYAVVPQASVMRFVAANYLGRLRAFGDSPLPLLSRVVEFLLLGGSLALPSYFAGLRRAIEEAREHEVSELQLLKQETDLRLLVLQAQIEPHFLFNTLASLRSLLRQDVDRAEAMIDALVEHLRAAMPIFRENQQHSALSEQLRICSSYLELMQVRLADRLTYTIVVAEPLRSAAFPPLILLTLVENAVKHGIEPKPGPGHIRIEVTRSPRVDGTHIIVSVTDNGAGLSAGLGHGVGLSNIRAQLALKYGDRATLSLMSNADGGAVASVDIPESDVNESPCAQLTRRLS
jgi:sensor histidine kinase YesM